MTRLRSICLPTLLLLQFSVYAQEKIDTGIVAAIRDQAFNHSQVMDIAFHLTDASGPRLSNSPGLVRAQSWAKEAMAKWGLSDIDLEPWGTFGHGWEVQKCYLALKEPYYQTLTACPQAWTQGSDGPFEAEVVFYGPKDSAEQAALRGQLRGKLIMYPGRLSVNPPSFTAGSVRYSDSDLIKMQAPDIQPAHRVSVAPVRVATPPSKKEVSLPRPRRPRMLGPDEFFKQEGVLGILNRTGRDEGVLFIGGGGSRTEGATLGPLNLVLIPEDYNRLERLMEAGIRVVLEGDVRTRSIENDSIGYNVVGEIPGTDPLLKDQLVMLGGHLDSWHAATGATDNGAGASVMLEVARILEALHIRPRRTIRIVLWSGEEQGLLGSRGYVRKHFGDPDTHQWTSDQAKVSAYYNLDNGTGKIRGIYLQEDSAAGPIFQQWLGAFADLGAATITIQNTGGTDHQSFVAVGIPGFQFIQDPIEYYNHTHHSNWDSYDHLIPEDLRQASAIIAAFVYQTAMRDEMIPRKGNL